MKKLLYIGWLGQNNTGDELMWDIFKDLCDKYKVSDNYNILNNLQHGNLNDLSGYDVVVLGGGSLLLPGYIDMIYNGLNLGCKVFVWGSGYDWAEKEFVSSLIKTNTPSYLYPDETELILEELVPKCEFFGVRGPLTYSILEKSFIDISNLIISGDPGFALKEKPLEDYMPISSLNENDKIVALNWGTTYNRLYGEDEEKIEDDLAKICDYLIEKGYKVYLYLMWDEDMKSFMNLCKKIKPSNNLIVDRNVYSGGQVLSILKRCVFSINLKLHGNITSATANVPFICLGYRFKCFDFVKSIGCDKLIIPTDSNDIYSDLINKIDYVNENYDEIKLTMKTYIDDYKTKIELPFSKNLF